MCTLLSSSLRPWCSGSASLVLFNKLSALNTPYAPDDARLHVIHSLPTGASVRGEERRGLRHRPRQVAPCEWRLPHPADALGQETPAGGTPERHHRAPHHLRPLERDESPLQPSGQYREAADRAADQSGQVGADVTRAVLAAAGGGLPDHVRDGSGPTARAAPEADQREGVRTLHEYNLLEHYTNNTS